MDYLKGMYTRDDILIGVDNGVDVLVRNGFMPDIAIGDFDSMQTDISALGEGCEIVTLNIEKDKSDLEYAVDYIAEKKDMQDYEMVIVNNLQGRIDHIMSTVYLLEKYPLAKIVSAEQELFLVNGRFTKELPLDSCVSLIPISKEVRGITTSGFYYYLDNETLYRENSRGVSNKSVENVVNIAFEEGVVLCTIRIFV
jgi:thiamine pyrophosphokinase